MTTTDEGKIIRCGCRCGCARLEPDDTMAEDDEGDLVCESCENGQHEEGPDA